MARRLKPLISDEEHEMIARAIATAPPLTSEQITDLKRLLRPCDWTHNTAAATASPASPLRSAA